MNRLLAAGLAVSLLFVAKDGAAQCDRENPLHVLFIGNSFLYVQNVPHMVEEIASSLSGPCVETAMIASGGATLEQHWRGEQAQARIRDGHWTHVVLNDQSTFAEGWWLEGDARIGTSGRELSDYGSRFAQLIRASGAKPLLVAHWSDAKAPQRDQQALDFLFAGVAREAGIELVDAGRAIKRMQKELPDLSPYFIDDHHLSPAGAYLEALMIYSTLAKHSVAGAARQISGPAIDFNRGAVSSSIVSLVDLTEPQAAAVQRIADTTYAEAPERLRWIPSPQPLTAEFPPVPGDGEAVRAGDLAGRWRGTSCALPNPAHEPAEIELSFGQNGMMSLRTRDLSFAGAVTASVEGKRIVVTGAVLPQDARGRGRAQPLTVELKAVKRGNTLAGVVSIQQRFEGTASSFNAIGRFEATRVE